VPDADVPIVAFVLTSVTCGFVPDLTTLATARCTKGQVTLAPAVPEDRSLGDAGRGRHRADRASADPGDPSTHAARHP